MIFLHSHKQYVEELIINISRETCKTFSIINYDVRYYLLQKASVGKQIPGVLGDAIADENSTLLFMQSLLRQRVWLLSGLAQQSYFVAASLPKESNISHRSARDFPVSSILFLIFICSAKYSKT